MQVDLLPLLKTQRKLLDQPRGFGRFRSYLDTMVSGDGELLLPLPAFNPMSKPHVAELLDKLLAMEAEAIAAGHMRQSATRLQGLAVLHQMPAYRFGLVIADDAQGGWTNRYLFEAKDRFENKYAVNHGFITALLWSSESPDAIRIRCETAAAIFRTAWLWTHGLPRTLGEMLRQEGLAQRFAATPPQAADPSLIALVREHWQSTHYPTIMACLYGDDAAETLGYPRIGISGRGAMPCAASIEIIGGEDPVESLRRPGIAERSVAPLATPGRHTK